MRIKRNGLLYSVLILMVMAMGLSSRHFSAYLPVWINNYLGDMLWALMVFLLFGLIFNKRSTKHVALLAVVFSFSIEISQLYHSHWIDEIRRTRLGGLVLGYGFLWRDLISYFLGITAGYSMEKIIGRPK